MLDYDEYVDDCLYEASLGRVLQHIKNENVFGAVTAFRGVDSLNRPITRAENKKRNKKLEAEIKSAGYGFVKAKGFYIENFGTKDANPVQEDTFFVFPKDETEKNNIKSDLVKWGAKYDQESILYVEDGFGYLVGTGGYGNEGGMSKGQTIKIGKFAPSKLGEFYTKIKKRPFTFEGVYRPLDTFSKFYYKKRYENYLNENSKPRKSKKDMEKVLKAIAKKAGFETLKVRNMDSLDFTDVYVGRFREALEAAYKAGVESVK